MPKNLSLSLDYILKVNCLYKTDNFKIETSHFWNRYTSSFYSLKKKRISFVNLSLLDYELLSFWMYYFLRL